MDSIEEKYSFKEIVKSLSFKEIFKSLIWKLKILMLIILFSSLLTYLIDTFIYHGDSERFHNDFNEVHIILINKMIYAAPLAIEWIIYALAAFFVLSIIIIILFIVIFKFLNSFRNN